MVFKTPEQFIFDRDEVNLLEVSGPDSIDFLNRLSTVNFKNFKTVSLENSIHGAFLTGQAKLISIFTAWHIHEKFYFFVETEELFQRTKDYLEKMHFAENLKIEAKKYFCIEARGEVSRSNFSTDDLMVNAYNWGIPGYYYFTALKTHMEKFNSKKISETEYDAIRASFGFPKLLKDLSDDQILIEGPFDDFIDRNKGCYPGQEVIEKIYTYGRVAKKIKKIIFENISTHEFEELQKSLPLEIKFEGNNIGVLTSVYSNAKSFGLATLKRLFYEKNEKVEVSFKGFILKAKIK